MALAPGREPEPTDVRCGADLPPVPDWFVVFGFTWNSYRIVGVWLSAVAIFTLTLCEGQVFFEVLRILAVRRGVPVPHTSARGRTCAARAASLPWDSHGAHASSVLSNTKAPIHSSNPTCCLQQSTDSRSHSMRIANQSLFSHSCSILSSILSAYCDHDSPALAIMPKLRPFASIARSVARQFCCFWRFGSSTSSSHRLPFR